MQTLYRRAVAVCQHHRQFSISLIQRALGCGYGDASRLVAKMKRNGVTV